MGFNLPQKSFILKNATNEAYLICDEMKTLYFTLFYQNITKYQPNHNLEIEQPKKTSPDLSEAFLKGRNQSVQWWTRS